jgi:hypothetical protein
MANRLHTHGVLISAKWLALLNYSYKRFDFSGELDYGHYGLRYQW